MNEIWNFLYWSRCFIPNSDKKQHTHHCFLGRCPFSGFASALWLMLAQCPRPWDRELQQMLLDGIDAGLSLWFAVGSACIFLKQNRDFLRFKNVYIYIYTIWFANVTCCFVVFHSSFVQRLHDFYWLLRTICWKFCGSMSCSDMLLLDSFKKKTCSKVEVEATRTRSLYTYSYLMTDQYIDIYKTSPFVEHCSTNGCKLFQYAEILHLCFFFVPGSWWEPCSLEAHTQHEWWRRWRDKNEEGISFKQITGYIHFWELFSKFIEMKKPFKRKMFHEHLSKVS